MRRRLIAKLVRTGTQVRRISTDHYAHTLEALVWTTLLAVPIPLLVGFVAWALGQAFHPSDWLRGISHGLRIAAWCTLSVLFFAEVCRPGGLGTAHFRWPDEILRKVRGAILATAIIYIPALATTISFVYGDASHYIASVGRLSFLLAHVWVAIVLYWLFCSSNGVIESLGRVQPAHWMVRWRRAWMLLHLAVPSALALLAVAGYVIAAFQLSLELVTTAGLVAGGEILYCLVLRWFTIKQRKLALAEALAKRRARQESTAAEESDHESTEVVSVDSEEEEELDLELVSEQTRHVIRLFASLAVAIAIVLLWSGTVPLIPFLEAVPLPLLGGLSLLELCQAILIAVVVYVVSYNLPGLLELAALRATTINPGTRIAISTLAQYAVIAIGIGLTLNLLNVDWAAFGWIAAALSVGLGFGLQEVVANFVCGLILLFERPIRVGDIVTVEGMTGTVTRIHMRATTITNWERQEFVVPNKNLITSTILNWTLSSAMNRATIVVGVAYGSDTEKARQILLEVAAEHPLVLDDPAPMATFEEFADSSLTLLLRVYLPDLDNRLATITELHTEIDKRFAAASIEIAFPQRDLHLRTGWESSRFAEMRPAVEGGQGVE